MVTILWVRDYNATVYKEMMQYYNAIGEPIGVWDGVSRYEGAMGSDVDATYKYYFNGYVGRVGEPSPVTMETVATMDEDGSKGSVTIKVTPEEALSGSYQLTCAIYQKLFTGSNPYIPHLGLKRIYNDTIVLNSTDTVKVDVDFNTDFWWDLEDLGVVAYVRNLSTKEILQGSATETFEAPPAEGRRHVRPF